MEVIVSEADLLKLWWYSGSMKRFNGSQRWSFLEKLIHALFIGHSSVAFRNTISPDKGTKADKQGSSLKMSALFKTLFVELTLKGYIFVGVI